MKKIFILSLMIVGLSGAGPTGLRNPSFVASLAPDDPPTPPGEESFLLRENGDRILREEGGGILLTDVALFDLLRENGDKILREEGGVLSK